MSVFSPRLVLISFVQNTLTHIAQSVRLAVICSILDAEKLIQTAQSLITNLNVVYNAETTLKSKEFHVCLKIDKSY